MSQRAVEETFNALFAITDLRFVLREAKPTFRLDAGQRERVATSLAQVRRSADAIERELLGAALAPAPAAAPAPGTVPRPPREGGA